MALYVETSNSKKLTGQSMEAAFFLLCVLQALVAGAFCYYIAGQKNRDQGNWFVLGFFFSFIALLALIAVPKIEEFKGSQPSYASSTLKPAVTASAASERACPYCAETIKAAAKICRFCQRDVQPETSQAQTSGEVIKQPVDQEHAIDWSKKDEKYCLDRLRSCGYEVVFSVPSKWSIISPSKGSTSFAYSISDLQRIARRET